MNASVFCASIILAIVPTAYAQTTSGAPGGSSALRIDAPRTGTSIEQQSADPADADFKRAREVLNGGDMRRAADLFKALVAKYPGSPLAPDALYWQAYALHRAGPASSGLLRLADDALQARIDRYPNRTAIPDAQPLRERIAMALSTVPSGGTYRNGQLTIEGNSSRTNTVSLPTFRSGRSGRSGGSDFQLIQFAVTDAGTSAQVTLPSGPGCAPVRDDSRIHAVAAASRLESKAAVEALGEFITFSGSCPERIRVAAAYVTANLIAPEAVRLLVRAATSDQSVAVRNTAFTGLGRIRATSAIGALDSILSHSTDPYVKERALSALTARPEPEAKAIIARLAADDRSPVELRRQTPTRTQRSVLTSTEVGYLTRLRDRTKDKSLRDRIRAALVDSSQTAGREILVAAVLDPTLPLGERETALSSLSPTFLSPLRLISMYDRLDGLPDLQGTLLDRMANSRDQVALDKVIRVARTGGNAIVAKRAVSALVRINDPRAPALLMDLVRNPVEVKK